MGLLPVNEELRFCVIGAGRIGLPISVKLAEEGCPVKLLERDDERCLMINKSSAPFYEEGMQDSLAKAVSEGLLMSGSDPSVISDCNVIISAIGTGILEDGTPDIGGIESLVELLAPHLRHGDLVLLKTTLPIGTTEEIGALLAEASGLVLDDGLLIAFSPERIVEGRAMEELGSLPKIVGGVGPNSTSRACEVMSIFGGRVIEVSNAKTAEMCKLLDNAYRMTRFGFSADVATVALRNGIDAYEAISAANRDYPRNSIPFPSIGVSGYCLSKDPFYLEISAVEDWSSRGFQSVWMAARGAADYQISLTINELKSHFGGSLLGKRIVVAGATFKENVDDIRESHGVIIAELLSEAGCDVSFWDPVTSKKDIGGMTVHEGEDCVEGIDCLIITVPHSEFVAWANRLPEIGNAGLKCIYDGWGIIPREIGGWDDFTLMGTGYKRMG